MGDNDIHSTSADNCHGGDIVIRISLINSIFFVEIILERLTISYSALCARLDKIS